MNTANKLQKQIMRRVYMAFAKRVATHQVTMQVALFVLALYVFGAVVHVKRIVDALLSTSAGSIPSYIAGAFMHAEVLTLIAVGTMVFVALSIPWQFRSQSLLRSQAV